MHKQPKMALTLREQTTWQPLMDKTDYKVAYLKRPK